MIIKYQFEKEVVEVEVSEEWGNIIVDLDRQEYNNNHKNTRRHCSFEALDADHALLASDEDISLDFIKREDKKRLYAALSLLSERQQRFIYKVYFENKTYAEVGAEEGVQANTAWDVVQRAIKKLKNILS